MNSGFKGKKILLVDDESDLREIIRDDLEFYGAEVFEAANGRAALEVFTQIRPDLLISDVRMAGGDGIELLKAIRALPEGKTVPVLLMTGFADVSEQQAIELGASGMVSKPFNLKSLRAIILDCLNAKPG